MMTKAKSPAPDQDATWRLVEDVLKEKGIDLENLCCDKTSGSGVKVVCIAPGLEASFKEMEMFPRGQTVMVRTDEETSRTLDAWVETGHFRSRSEAAALFLREGLKLRASELEKLTDALHEVKRAKERLHEKAGKILGKKERAA